MPNVSTHNLSKKKEQSSHTVTKEKNLIIHLIYGQLVNVIDQVDNKTLLQKLVFFIV